MGSNAPAIEPAGDSLEAQIAELQLLADDPTAHAVLRARSKRQIVVLRAQQAKAATR
jgi:hypothetical protein